MADPAALKDFRVDIHAPRHNCMYVPGLKTEEQISDLHDGRALRLEASGDWHSPLEPASGRHQIGYVKSGPPHSSAAVWMFHLNHGLPT